MDVNLVRVFNESRCPSNILIHNIRELQTGWLFSQHRNTLSQHFGKLCLTYGLGSDPLIRTHVWGKGGAILSKKCRKQKGSSAWLNTVCSEKQTAVTAYLKSEQLLLFVFAFPGSAHQSRAMLRRKATFPVPAGWDGPMMGASEVLERAGIVGNQQSRKDHGGTALVECWSSVRDNPRVCVFEVIQQMACTFRVCVIWVNPEVW